MANSRYEYVKKFEQDHFDDKLMAHCWPIVRVDGKNFHKFTEDHEMDKPNDIRLLKLMNYAALKVMEKFDDLVLAYGQSDEYSFMFRKKTNAYNRRASKLSSTIVSLFTSSFVYYWEDFFSEDGKKLQYPPVFDSRAISYPHEVMRHYWSWRQVDCHINNQYNTPFWCLVKSGKTPKEAQLVLKGTSSADKNELMFSQFNINYNDLPQIFRKGTVIVRNDKKDESKSGVFSTIHEDIIGKKFWEENSYLLEK